LSQSFYLAIKTLFYGYLGFLNATGIVNTEVSVTTALWKKWEIADTKKYIGLRTPQRLLASAQSGATLLHIRQDISILTLLLTYFTYLLTSPVVLLSFTPAIAFFREWLYVWFANEIIW